MKKRILLFVLAVALPIGSIFAQMSYNHWSIQGKGGVSTIKGFGADGFDRDYNAEYGGAIEYTLTPVIGLGVEYLYQNNDHPSYDFTSSISQATLFSSFNISNFTTPFRRGFWKHFNTYATIGGGFGFGSYTNRGITSTTDKSGDVMNLAIGAGLNFEFNLGKAISLGLEPQYRWNSNGKYNPAAYSRVKDFYTVNLNLRYKIGGSKMHIRNQNYVDYWLDQIENVDHKFRQEEGAKTKMQQLLIEQAKKEALIKDSLRNDSILTDSISQATDLHKKNTEDGVYFKKTGQNVSKQEIIDLSGDSTSTTEPIIEQAIEQPQQIMEETTGPIIEPIVETTTENIQVSNQPVTMKTETHSGSDLKRYSIVIGSFSNRTNAEKLSSKLLTEGITANVVQNEQGMYRVITHTTNGIDSAVSQVKKMRNNYPDSWILVLK